MLTLYHLSSTTRPAPLCPQSMSHNAMVVLSHPPEVEGGLGAPLAKQVSVNEWIEIAIENSVNVANFELSAVIGD